jgi:hypothetical protein
MIQRIPASPADAFEVGVGPRKALGKRLLCDFLLFVEACRAGDLEPVQAGLGERSGLVELEQAANVIGGREVEVRGGINLPRKSTRNGTYSGLPTNRSALAIFCSSRVSAPSSLTFLSKSRARASFTTSSARSLMRNAAACR